jgi:hypothetical protein
MPLIEATHWICGTPVSAEVPDDYDLEEGVALACTTCQDVWWHYPLAQGAAGETGVDATLAGRRLGPGKESRSRRHAGLATNWIGPALVLCVIALVLLRLSDLGPRSTATPAAAAQTANGSAADAGGGPYVHVVAPLYRIDRPAVWVRFPRNDAQVLSPARSAPLTVSIYADLRPGVSLDQMAGLTRQLLVTQLPKAKITGPVSLQLGGADGRLITARRGAFLRETLVVAADDYRYVVQVAARAGASRGDLARVDRIVHSFRATPA